MTELTSLKPYDRRTSANILAVAALLAAPNPGIATQSYDAELRNSAEAVLAELAERIDSSRANLRSKNAALNAALSYEMRQALQGDTSEEEALARAGQAGRLMPSLYKVVQPKSFRHNFGPLGIKKHDVELAVRFPFEFQHLLADSAEGRAKEDLSLFMRTIAPSGQTAYWLLVQAVRQGISQQVTSAWRVYPEEVNLENANSPLDILKAFVEVYGLPLTLAGITSKFIEGTKIPTYNGQATWEVNVSSPSYRSTMLNVSHNLVKDGSFQNVGIDYNIDIDKYIASIKKYDRSIH